MPLSAGKGHHHQLEKVNQLNHENLMIKDELLFPISSKPCAGIQFQSRSLVGTQDLFKPATKIIYSLFLSVKTLLIFSSSFFGNNFLIQY
jgi:hypothetical protein